MSGDVAALDEAIETGRQLEEERKANLPSQQQRAADAAASQARDAFTRGEYLLVTKLLGPHLELLLPSHRKLYEIARQRTGDAQ